MERQNQVQPMPRKLNKARLFRNVILAALAVGCIAFYFSNRFVKSKGFENLGDFIANYSENKALIDGSTTESIKIDLSKADYQFLEEKRQIALDRGIQINEGDSYVPCKLEYKDQKVKGELRLKGHMTDHLEGQKWSFRVKTDEEVMGMYRFSLQNPATRNYAYEWIYHQLLAYEGIIHLKYDFVHLQLNDLDLGIYAVEEHFGQHILRDNNRPKGAILRWNPELYWEQRIDELNGMYMDEGYSDYSASYPEAYDEGVVKKDPELIETYRIGAALLESFRRGDKTSSEVFDLEKMARFHAIIDLVGGYHSLDWSDLKFYYNSESKRIEPVGYESFSVRETVKIAGQRTPDDYATVGFNYHDRLFADPLFFAAYIHELERICDNAYFSAFTESIEDELKLKRGILAKEFAYIKFSFTPYYDNIERINRNLNLPKACHAFLENKSDSTVEISLSPVSDYPIEIVGLMVGEKEFLTIDSAFVLPPKARDTYAHYYSVYFSHDDLKLKKLKIQARIPGSKNVFEVEVSDLPAYKGAIEWQVTANVEQNKTDVLTWLNDSVAQFKGTDVVVSAPIFIEAQKKLLVQNNQSIQFIGDGQLIVQGQVKFFGGSDREINVTADESLKNRIFIDGGELLAVHTVFHGMEDNFIQVQNGELNFQFCSIADARLRFIKALNSTITLIDCASGSMNSLGYFDRSLVRIKNFTGKKGETFITGAGSDIEIYSSTFSNYDRFADLNYTSNLSNWSCLFDQIDVYGSLNNDSQLNSFAGQVTACRLGYEMNYESGDLFSSYLNQRMVMGVEELEKHGKR